MSQGSEKSEVLSSAQENLLWQAKIVWEAVVSTWNEAHNIVSLNDFIAEKFPEICSVELKSSNIGHIEKVKETPESTNSAYDYISEPSAWLCKELLWKVSILELSVFILKCNQFFQWKKDLWETWGINSIINASSMVSFALYKKPNLLIQYFNEEKSKQFPDFLSALSSYLSSK